MKLIDAIKVVLQQANEPMHVKDIYWQIKRDGLWKSSGKTPDATVGAQIYTDIKINGNNSSFVKMQPQVFALKQNVDKSQPKSNIRKDTIEKRLSFSDCAEKVLQKYGNKKPMHYRDITKYALKNKWLNTEGKTPEATMYAQIITEIKRKQKRGEQPRFVQHSRGMVGLSNWQGKGLTYQIYEHNKKVSKELLKTLQTMDPFDFEELVYKLLSEMGFELVKRTKLSGDGGIDVRGTLIISEGFQTKMAIQVKRWKHNIQSPEIQKVRGSLDPNEQGLIITTSDFSKGAKSEANHEKKTAIGLINGLQLVKLLMEHGVGVHRTTPDIFEVDEDFFMSLGGKELS